MKKLLSLALVLAMVLTMSVTAFAATIDGNSGKVDVTYGVDESYTVSIPAETTLSKDSSTTIAVSVPTLVIGYGQQLTVSVSSTNYSESKWYLVDTTNTENKLEYSIKNGETAVASGDTILTVAAGTTESQTVSLTAKLEGTATYAGTYKDTLTFSVDVKDSSEIVTGLKAEKDTYHFDCPVGGDISAEVSSQIKFTVTYAGGHTETIAYNAEGLTLTPVGDPFNTNTDGKFDYTASYGGQTCTFAIEVELYMVD